MDQPKLNKLHMSNNNGNNNNNNNQIIYGLNDKQNLNQHVIDSTAHCMYNSNMNNIDSYSDVFCSNGQMNHNHEMRDQFGHSNPYNINNQNQTTRFIYPSPK